jgi:hypothetical protein
MKTTAVVALVADNGTNTPVSLVRVPASESTAKSAIEACAMLLNSVQDISGNTFRAEMQNIPTSKLS